MTGGTHHCERAAGAARPFGHSVEAEAVLARRAGGGVESDAVVADREHQLLGMSAQLDVDMLGLAVPGRIRQSLLADAEQSDLGRRRERRVLGHGTGPEPRRDPGSLLPYLD